MITSIICKIGLGIGVLGVVSISNAQSVSAILNQPAQRDAVIDAGHEFLAEREKLIVSDKGAPDPFIGKVEEVAAPDPSLEAPVVKAVINEAELLQNLASRISARGTAIMGTDKFLLLSQKRLKVGDSTIINFEGRDYEVWLSDVTSTTFTIRRNDLTFTRAVLLSR
jgi:hypothetical protein